MLLRTFEVDVKLLSLTFVLLQQMSLENMPRKGRIAHKSFPKCRFIFEKSVAKVETTLLLSNIEEFLLKGSADLLYVEKGYVQFCLFSQLFLLWHEIEHSNICFFISFRLFK